MAVAAEKEQKRGGANEESAKGRFRGEVYVVRERCKGCGFCVEFCPNRSLALDEVFNRRGYHPPVVVDLDSCNGCDLCGLYCPDFAIHGVRRKAQGEAR